jgi:hypothetical protein
MRPVPVKSAARYVGSISPGPDFGLMVLLPTENARSEAVDITVAYRELRRCFDVQVQVPLQRSH